MTKSTGIKEQEKTVIFLHIPKAGGSSLQKTIERQYRQNDIYHLRNNSSKRTKECVDKFETLSEVKKKEIKIIVGHMGFGLHNFLSQPSVYITLLRDPVARIISHYYYVLRQPHHFLHEIVVSRKMSLEEYVLSGISTDLDNGQTRNLSATKGVADSSIAFGDCSKEMLQRAKKNLDEHFLGVGLVESYDKSILLFKKLLNWNNIYYLKRNVTKNRPLETDFSQETLNIIRKQNHLDLELYEYAANLFQEQISRQGSAFEDELQKFQWRNKLYGNTYGKLHSLASSIVK